MHAQHNHQYQDAFILLIHQPFPHGYFFREKARALSAHERRAGETLKNKTNENNEAANSFPLSPRFLITLFCACERKKNKPFGWLYLKVRSILHHGAGVNCIVSVEERSQCETRRVLFILLSFILIFTLGDDTFFSHTFVDQSLSNRPAQSMLEDSRCSLFGGGGHIIMCRVVRTKGHCIANRTNRWAPLCAHYKKKKASVPIFYFLWFPRYRSSADTTFNCPLCNNNNG